MTSFLATGTITAPDRLAQHADEEARVLGELRAEGTVREAFRFIERQQPQCDERQPLDLPTDLVEVRALEDADDDRPLRSIRNR